MAGRPAVSLTGTGAGTLNRRRESAPMIAPPQRPRRSSASSATLVAGMPVAGEHEVVCHNGLSPKNTVYRSRSPGAETSSVGTGAVMLGRRCVEPWRGGE